MLAIPLQRMFRIPDFKTTFNADGTIQSTGPDAVDTLIMIRNLSGYGKRAHVCFWHEQGDLVHDLTIALEGVDTQLFYVAPLLRGTDPRALPCPHRPNDPKGSASGPFATAYLFQTLCQLSFGKPPLRVAGTNTILINPIHGSMTIEELDLTGRETTLRVGYVTDRADSLRAKADVLMADAWLTERLTLPDDLPVAFCPPVVYSRPAWGNLGRALPEAQRNVRVAERLITSAGWEFIGSRPDGRVYKRRGKRITIPGELDDDLSPRTFNSILKQAGLKGK